MGNSRSIYGYMDIKHILERAGASQDGIKIRFSDAREARYFIGRCNSFRALDRKQNMVLYHLGHPMHPTEDRGESYYDDLRISLRDNTVFIGSYMTLLPTYQITDAHTGETIHLGPDDPGAPESIPSSSIGYNANTAGHHALPDDWANEPYQKPVDNSKK